VQVGEKSCKDPAKKASKEGIKYWHRKEEKNCNIDEWRGLKNAKNI
jgi:hypothetical protein